jgi:hypothetical protein
MSARTYQHSIRTIAPGIDIANLMIPGHCPKKKGEKGEVLTGLILLKDRNIDARVHYSPACSPTFFTKFGVPNV